MNDNTPNYPHFSTSVYMPSGIRIFFTVPFDDWTTAYEGAQEFTDMLLAKGALLREPGLEAGEEKELIVTVMRRSKPSDGTPIIDMYTAWKEGGDEPWGTYKYMHMYLGNAELIAEFLQVSGIKSLDLIPEYDAQAPLKRTLGKRHPKEFAVLTPYYIVKKQGSEKTGSDGKVYKPWEFVRFESGSQSPQNAATSTPAAAQVQTTTTAPETPQMGDLETIPFIAPGDKQWWPTFWQYVTPLYDAPKHAQASVKLMTGTNPPTIDASKMNVAQAVGIVRQHIQTGQA